MIELLGFIRELIGLYRWVLVAVVILDWLVKFQVINIANPLVRTIVEMLTVVTEPVLRPIRTFLWRKWPQLRSVDLSPIVAVLGCLFVEAVIIPNVAKLFL